MSRELSQQRKYVNSRLICDEALTGSKYLEEILARLTKTFDLLPGAEQQLFFSGNRKIFINIVSDPKLPFGMKTRSITHKSGPRYTIFVCEECGEWPEDRFLGAFLRELGHVVAEIPPEEDWPATRGERARFKESSELLADGMLWKWGLRHYDMSYLVATFPSHWVDRIVSDIEKLLEHDERFKREPTSPSE